MTSDHHDGYAVAPGLISLVDQFGAEFGRDLDLLVEVDRRLSARRGEAQAQSDILAYLVKDPRWDETTIKALLAVAVRRLRRGAVGS